MLGKEYVLGTVLRYERTVTYLSEFLQLRYQLTNIPMKNLDNAFVTNFEHFIKTKKNYAQNATVKYLKNLKRITKIALINKWMEIRNVNLKV